MSAEISTIRENPFSNSTDPRLAYFDMPRRNTVARLLTGLYQGDGLFLLVGEDGIGKTTLLRHLGVQVTALAGVRLLHTTAFICCSDHASFANIVDGCAATFGAAGVDPLQFARMLQDLAADGEQMPAILIDDADRLDDAGLRAIATLTTLRGGERRLLSAVLAGTRELPQRLAKLSGMADPLPADRVIQLSGMSRGEVERMIRHRLRQVGRADVEIALQPAISELAGQCNGVPLQVLGLCRRALHAAETPAPRLSSPAAAPVSVAADLGSAADAIDFTAATTTGSAGMSTESAAAGNARPAADLVSPSAGDLSVEGFVGAVSVQPTEAPAAVDTGGGSSAEFPGHIRYTAASARRVESARWQSGGGRRRHPGRRASLAVGAMLVVLAVGWAVYDHTPRRVADAGTSHTGVVDPITASTLAPSPSLVPSPLTSSPPLALPPTSAPEAQSTMVPALPSAPSSTEAWWRSPSMAEGMRTDVQPVPSDTTGSTTGSTPYAPSFSSVVKDQGEKPADLSSPPPDRQTARRELPERPAAGSSIPSRPAPKSAPPTVAPRPATITAVSAKPVAAEALPARPTEAKQMPPSRQKDALLMEGDEQLLAGEVEAARAIYQEAFDRGSVEAARRLAQTFDPRNVSATSTEASAAEAILWYKDAEKRGDRRARGELQGLESWLEDAAASGNGEARRVLQTWRAPPTADDPAGGSQAEP